MSKGNKTSVTALVIILFLIAAVLLGIVGMSKTFIALLALGLISGLKSMWGNTVEAKNEIVLDKTKSDTLNKDLTRKDDQRSV